MRLLTPTQNNSAKQSQTVRDILRVQEMDKASNKARIELANAQADFNDALARNREAWAKEEEEHRLRIKEMGEEIAMLNAQKAQAMIPVHLAQTKADAALEEATDYLIIVKKREEAAEQLTEALQDKLDDVGQREIDLRKLNQELAIKTSGIRMQEEATIQNSKLLTKQMEEFKDYCAKQEEHINEVKTVLFLKERSLVAKEDSNKRTDEALNQLAIKLADDRKTLDQGFGELRKLQSNIPMEKTK